MEVAGPLGTPLGLAQRKRASPRGEAGTSGFLDLAGPRASFSLAVTLRPHLCSQDPHLSLLPSFKGSGIQEELEELLPAVGPQAHPVVAMTTMPASIFFKPLSPALPLSLSCCACAFWVPLQ